MGNNKSIPDNIQCKAFGDFMKTIYEINNDRHYNIMDVIKNKHNEIHIIIITR